MKRNFTLLSLTAFSAMAMAQFDPNLNGDLNHNGQIDAGDVIMMQQIILGNSHPEAIYEKDGDITFQDATKIWRISLDKTELTLHVGESYQLIAKIYPETASSTPLMWLTADSEKVFVDQEGTVTACHEGINDVLVKSIDGTQDAICTVTVIGSEAGPNMYNGHEYVDLGLKDADGKPIYWATCNIGAEKPEDYGLYFAWGETVGYGFNIDVDSYNGYSYTTTDDRKFDWASYSSDLCGGSSTTMKKYCIDSNYGTVDNKTVLDPEDDAAHVNWGGDWRMPSEAEQDELRNKCTWTWTTQNGVNGYKVTGPNGNSIFLPAAGYRNDGSLFFAGSDGLYWSSSLYTSSSDNAYYLDFNSGSQYTHDDSRYYGQSVRPVCQ